MKHFGITILLMVCFTCSVYAEEPKTVSNEMLLEKMELYQKLNNTKFELVFNEIKNLREDMNKRFEQVDKRFEFNQQLILLLLTLTLATPVGVEIWRKKQDKKIHKKVDTLAAIIAEFSKTDERIRSAIKYVKEQGLTLSPNMAYSI